MDELQRDLRTQVNGVRVGTVFEGARRVTLILRGSDQLRSSPAEFSNLRFALPNGEATGLGDLVSLERTEGPVAIKREKSKRMAVVIANVAERDLVSFVEEAKQTVDEKLQLSTGYYLEWGGQFENQQRAAKRLSRLFPLRLV